jgi:hypothetical protein
MSLSADLGAGILRLQCASAEFDSEFELPFAQRHDAFGQELLCPGRGFDGFVVGGSTTGQRGQEQAREDLHARSYP